jgi:chorismate mutase/prephenate dehydratase
MHKSQGMAANLKKALTSLRKDPQSDELLKNERNWRLGVRITKGSGRVPSVNNVAIQGNPASYAAIAANRAFPDATVIGFRDLGVACAKTAAGEIDAAILPLDNSTEGTVNEVYDLLLQYRLNIFTSVLVDINHCLLALPGTDLQDVRVVLSHPQALAQCRDFIRKMDWETLAVENTAFAAEGVAGSKDKTRVAIASKKAACLYGLEILADNINNNDCNQTKFVAVCKEIYIPADAGTVSIAFSLPHKSGELASVLSVFADLNINLTKIQSRPIPQSPWEYYFYLDFSCETGNRGAMTALYQLEQELPIFHFLGWYS